jgi:hypothetical protein
VRWVKGERRAEEALRHRMKMPLKKSQFDEVVEGKFNSTRVGG